jgi:hypothetical protein
VGVRVKPGDIVVYRERAECFQRDKILRATLAYDDGPKKLYVTRREVLNANLGMYTFTTFPVSASDVIRVEPAQHGWGQ